MTTRIRLVRSIALLFALVLLAIGASAGITQEAAHAAAWIPVTGRGSTWSQNALDQWRRNVASNYGMTINYTGDGSSAGRRAFLDGTVDFAISEIPFQSAPEDGSASERPTTGFAYMPIVAGGTSFMYNLKIGGKRVTNLRLSGESITKIFTGVIKNWNDPQIKADNPALAMPDKAIVPVVRSDGSGSTAQFTLWMSKQHPALWNAFCTTIHRATPCGFTSQYPNFDNAKAQDQSRGVAGYVSQDYGEGAITYVEYSYALKSGFPVAKVLNASGYYVEPTASSVAVALLKAQINTNQASPDYLTQILDGVYNNPDKRSYPLSSYSYMIVPTQVAGIFTADKGKTLGAFTNYVLCEGQQQAAALGYSPLPMNLVLAGFDQIHRIPGADTSTVDINKCNNPTFKKGDSPSSNQLAVTAAQPAACDKQGTTQCATGTGGAKGSTAASGAGAGAQAGGGDTGIVSPDGSGALDGSGTLGDTAAGVAGAAVSSPFTMPDQGFGPGQYLMLFAGGLFVVVIVLPPLLSSRLKRSERDSDR